MLIIKEVYVFKLVKLDIFCIHTIIANIIKGVTAYALII